MSSLHTDACSISEVERDIGIGKDTLRVWERRYAFPQPLRDANGERIYPADQVQKLRLVQQLLDLGCRPGKIMQFDHAHLSQMAQELVARRLPPATPQSPELQHYLAMLKAHQLQALKLTLSQALLHIGLEQLVLDHIAPLTTLVGQAWARGELAVYEEHLYTEAVQVVLRNAIFALSQQRTTTATPRVLLTTVPQEQHGLGLLMAEAMFALRGAHCISLGIQTPLAQIVSAADSQRADIVALSFSSAMAARAMQQSLDELRSRLPATVELWIGGGGAHLNRPRQDMVQLLDLHAIASHIEQWRASRA